MRDRGIRHHPAHKWAPTSRAVHTGEGGLHDLSLRPQVVTRCPFQAMTHGFLTCRESCSYVFQTQFQTLFFSQQSRPHTVGTIKARRTLRRVGGAYLFGTDNICTADPASAPGVTVDPVKTALALAKPGSGDTARSGRRMFAPRFHSTLTEERNMKKGRRPPAPELVVRGKRTTESAS